MESTKNKSWWIYLHISPSNKVYVGITSRLPKSRWGTNGSRYLVKLTNGDLAHPLFARAILKYGWDNLKHIVLCKTTEKIAKIIEISLIKYYKERNLSYNITDGGDGRLGQTHTMSLEGRKRLSESKRGLIITKLWREKLSNSCKGKKKPTRTVEHIKNWKQSRLRNQKKVYQYSLDRQLVRVYDNIEEATQVLSCSSSSIYRSNRDNIAFRNYYFIIN